MSFLRRHGLELQFWVNGSGNVVASIAGAGGLSQILANLDGTGGWPALWPRIAHSADAITTLGVVLLVIVACPASRMATHLFGARCGALVPAVAVPLALALLVYAALAGASPLALAACAFVTGSCLLRAAAGWPILLKLAGLLLFLGGGAMAVAGWSLPWLGPAGTGLAVATTLSGVFAAAAGLMTWRGGTAVIAALDPPGRPRTTLGRMLHPTDSWLARAMARLDPTVRTLFSWLVTPAIFWVDADIKAHHPFYLSMLARLPWRAAAIGFGLSQGTSAGYAVALASGLWALGDIAIGALDAPARRVLATAQPMPR